MERVYLERVLDNALQLEGEWDYVVIHDPQPAAMLEYARNARRRAREHEVDLALPHRPHRRQPDGVEVLPGRSSSSTTRRCGRCPSSSPTRMPQRPRRCSRRRASTRSRSRTSSCRARSSRRSSASTACAPHDPLIVQVSRFDPWKDPVGVIEAFRIVREEFPNAQLVLAGSMATDDPEGFHYWELADEARAGDPDIHLVSNIQQVGSGADQRVPARGRRRDAEVAARGLRSDRERGAVEGPAGGRRSLRRHHHADPRRRERLPRRLRRRPRPSAPPSCCATRRAPTRWARPAASTCAATSSRRASSRTGCGSSEISGRRRMIVVSHRGPVPVRGERRRELRVANAGAGGVASALGALLEKSERDTTWIAAALSDDDRAAGRAGVTRRPRHRPPAGRARSRAARDALRRRVERRALVPVPRPLRPDAPARASTSASATRGTRTAR